MRRFINPVAARLRPGRSYSVASSAQEKRPNQLSFKRPLGPGQSLKSRPPPPRNSWTQKPGPRGPAPVPVAALPQVDGPIHDIAYVKSIRPPDADPLSGNRAPLSVLNNFTSAVHAHANFFPTTERVRVEHEGRSVALHRTTWSWPVGTTGITLNAVGDAPDANTSVKLAILHAVYQLAASGLLKKSVKELTAPAKVLLSNGTAIDTGTAKTFMDWYCRRYGLPKVELEHTEIPGHWEVRYGIAGRRLGIGYSANKKHAEDISTLDAARYIELSDPPLWVAYQEEVATGADLGLAPPVPFKVSPKLLNDIRDLTVDIKGSTLYRSGAGQVSSAPVIHRQQRRVTAPATEETLKAKSLFLQQCMEVYKKNDKLAAIRQQRAGLPVFSRIQDVLEHIEENDVSILMAATGSGKTTQIPQLLLDHWTSKGMGSNCNVLCTQPRRLAAISVAERVARERGEVIGRSIGYQVRFDTRLPQPNGSVTFCTVGIFLKRLQSQMEGTDNGLDNVTHIVVDEVHERDVDTDLLLVVLKRLIAQRAAEGKPLKVILMSATIDPTLFQTYFPDKNGDPAKVISIPGRSFPVNHHYLDDFIKDIKAGPISWVCRQPAVVKYLDAEFPALQPTSTLVPTPDLEDDEVSMVDDKFNHDADIPHVLIAATVAHVMQKTDDGHCLVFLPGWEDIVSVQKSLQNPEGPLGINFNDSSKISVHLLHSTVPLPEQQAIFEPAPAGVRRVILSTNIAETSVTIPDVVYVVDSARVKETRYDPAKHISTLVSAWIGRSNVFQRAGRAGRHRSGEYYGIMSRGHVDALPATQLVEIKRVDLSNVVMHIKALNFADMTVEDVLSQAIEPPEASRVALAINNLQLVGALTKEKGLTSLGRALLKIPLDVSLGRLVLYGSFFRCLDRALTFAAIMSNRDPFIQPRTARAESRIKKNSFALGHYRSDPIAALLAYEAWWALHSRGNIHGAHSYCIENFLSRPTFLMVSKVKDQLLSSLQTEGILDVVAAGDAQPSTPGGRPQVPASLNVNGDNLPLLSALITLAAQPRIAVKTFGNQLRTHRDRNVMMSQGGVNSKRNTIENREAAGTIESETQGQLYAYGESRMNMTGAAPQTTLSMTTRIDPLIYLLFGAHKVATSNRGLDCDEWLPLEGPHGSLDIIWRLKLLIDACLFRVFESIVHGGQHGGKRSEFSETEGTRDYSLTHTEIQELDFLTRDLVTILARFAEERGSASSVRDSRLRPPVAQPTREPPTRGFTSARRSIR